MVESLTINKAKNKMKFRPARSELKQVKEGDIVVVAIVEIGYLKSDITRYFRNVRIKIKTARKYIGEIISGGYFNDFGNPELIKFSNKDIVKTPYDDLNLHFLDFCHNFTINVSNEVIKTNEIAYMIKKKRGNKKNTGWYALAENENYPVSNENFIKIPVMNVIMIDEKILPILEEEANSCFAKNDNGEYQKIYDTLDRFNFEESKSINDKLVDELAKYIAELN